MENKNFWIADKEKLLNKFESQVKDKIYTKMPYKIWRNLKNNHKDFFSIIREYDKKHDSYYYMIENYPVVFDDDGFISGFGTFLNNNFNSPDLTYKINININTKKTFNTTPMVINSNDITINNDGSLCWDNVPNRWIDIINNENNNKEKNKMNTSNLFNFDFGPASSSQFRMSPYGLAVRTQANGWVAYNAKTGDLMDVDILNFDISKIIYKMPVALTAIKPGDILMHNGKPVFVREVATNCNTVRVIDYTNATVADILPVKSPFGFNFFTKICPLFDFDQMNANADNPFGNMLPFLMLNGEKDGDFDPTLLFMASAMTNSNIDFANNPLMMYFLMNRQDKSDILPFLMMMNNGIFNISIPKK